MIHLLRVPATEEQMTAMLEPLDIYIKVAVDIRQGILAGGGELHADCEYILLNSGSQSDDIWGADWIPFSKEVRYESLINLKPRQNRSMQILDPSVQERVAEIIRALLEEE